MCNCQQLAQIFMWLPKIVYKIEQAFKTAYLLILKQDLWGHLCSCRSLAQWYWSCTPIHWNIFSSSYLFSIFLSICWQKSCGFNAMKFSAYWRYKPGFYFCHCIRQKWVKAYIHQINYLLHMRVILTISKVL